MSHPANIIHCSGPTSPHALDGIPLIPRSGDLDRACPLCLGYGQWNAEIDLNSHRSKRCPCPRCDGRGWIETGDDMVPTNIIEPDEDGDPRWTVRLDPSADRLPSDERGD